MPLAPLSRSKGKLGDAVPDCIKFAEDPETDPMDVAEDMDDMGGRAFAFRGGVTAPEYCPKLDSYVSSSSSSSAKELAANPVLACRWWLR